MQCINAKSALIAALLGLGLVGCAVEDSRPSGTDTGTTTPDPDPRPQSTKWACDVDFGEMAADGYDDGAYTTDEFEFSSGVVVTTPYGMYASDACLDIVNAPGTVGLCIKGRDSNGNADDGRVTISTPGSFTGITAESCDHDFDVMVTVDGDTAYDYLPGAGEDKCAGQVTNLSFAESTGTTMRAPQDVPENPEAWFLASLTFTGEKCKN